MIIIKVITPDIGDFKDVPIIELLIKDGDTVEIDQPLITIESDKATMEIPSTHSGVVKKILIKVGDKISKGTPICDLQTENNELSKSDEKECFSTSLSFSVFSVKTFLVLSK